MILSLLAMTVAATAGDSYTVALTISRAGRVIATPQLVVRAGREARIEADRPDGYAVRVLVTPIAGMTPAAARVDSTVALKHDGRWLVVAAPMLTMRTGTTVTFTGSARAPGGPVTIRYRIDETR